MRRAERPAEKARGGPLGATAPDLGAQVAPEPARKCEPPGGLVYPSGPVRKSADWPRVGLATGVRAHGLLWIPNPLCIPCVRRIALDSGGPANGRPARDRRR
jgi:hypothetical protein